jgi:hypothetical protein
MDVLVASLYFDFPAGCAFFAAAAGDFAFFGAGFLTAEEVLLASAEVLLGAGFLAAADVLLASAEVLLGGGFLAIDVLHRLNRCCSSGYRQSCH